MHLCEVFLVTLLLIDILVFVLLSTKIVIQPECLIPLVSFGFLDASHSHTCHSFFILISHHAFSAPSHTLLSFTSSISLS